MNFVNTTFSHTGKHKINLNNSITTVLFHQIPFHYTVESWSVVSRKSNTITDFTTSSQPLKSFCKQDTSLPSLSTDLSKEEGRETSVAGRLEDNSIAHSQCWAHLPYQQSQRELPCHNSTHHTCNAYNTVNQTFAIHFFLTVITISRHNKA